MPKTCPDCGGSGRIRRPIKRSWVQILLGRPSFIDMPCGTCGMAGVEDRANMPTDSKSPSTPVAEHRFGCSRCSESAGVVQLFGAENAAEIVRTSFTSRLTGRVAAASFEQLRRAIIGGDARALYRLDLEFAPFFCPQCNACFCGAHWWRWDVFDEDGWHDSIRGTCPEGHERMLED